MKFIAALSILFLFSCTTQQTQEVPAPALPPTVTLKTPDIAFEVTDGILHPESALFSKAHKAIFVSNMASGNPLEQNKISYISKLGTNGKVIKSKWVTGLRAPKGLAIVGNYLYVSDINTVVKIDIKKARIVKTYNAPEAKFLNDVAADSKGNIYISDMGSNAIYIINKEGLQIWMKDTKLRSPNGIFCDGKEHLILALWGSSTDPASSIAKELGAIMTVPLSGNKDGIQEELAPRGQFDGIDMDANGILWVSDWMTGDIFSVKKNGESQKVYNLGQGTADISFAKDLGLLLIPQMSQNKIIAVRVGPN